MKDKKKMKVTEHADGSTTYTPTSGVGFYNPFCLLKKDFKLNTNIPVLLRNAFLLLEILKSIDQSNRVTTSSIQNLGSNFGIGKTAVTTFINELTSSNILIKISKGCYKVNEALVIFKQDHEGYLALQKETKSLTQPVTQNIYNGTVQNIQIVQKEGQSIGQAMVEFKKEQDRLMNL